MTAHERENLLEMLGNMADDRVQLKKLDPRIATFLGVYADDIKAILDGTYEDNSQRGGR